MKLHQTAIEKLVHLFENYGGHRGETKLRDVLAQLELSTYERQTSGETILVLTEDLEKETAAATAPPPSMTVNPITRRR